MKRSHYYFTLLLMGVFIVGALYGADKHRQRVYFYCVDNNKNLEYITLIRKCKEVAQ